MKIKSVKFEICILFVGIIGLFLVAYRSALFVNLRYTLFNEFNKNLNTKANSVSSTIKSYMDVLGEEGYSFIFSVKRAIRIEGEHARIDSIKEIEFQWPIQVSRYEPDQPNQVIAGTDMVALDAFCCPLLNVIPADVGHIVYLGASGQGQADISRKRDREISL